MPNMRRDHKSGALVFDKTPDEIRMDNLEKEVSDIKKQLNQPSNAKTKEVKE